MVAEQTFLNAGPLLLKATTDANSAALAGFAFNVLLIARAPLQLFQAIQTSILPHLTKSQATGEADQFRRSINVTLAAIAVFALCVALTMLAIGPWLMDLFFGSEFDYDRGGLVLVSVGMGLYLAAATLNQAALARGAAARAAACWVAAATAFVDRPGRLDLGRPHPAARGRLPGRRARPLLAAVRAVPQRALTSWSRGCVAAATRCGFVPRHVPAARISEGESRRRGRPRVRPGVLAGRSGGDARAARSRPRTARSSPPTRTGSGSRRASVRGRSRKPASRSRARATSGTSSATARRPSAPRTAASSWSRTRRTRRTPAPAARRARAARRRSASGQTARSRTPTASCLARA